MMDASVAAMARLTDRASNAGMELTTDTIRRTIARRSFCTLATSSPRHQPHSAGVLYEAVDLNLYFGTVRSSRKGRNIEANPLVGICIPVRRLPVGPPSSVHFAGRAELLAADDPEITQLLAAGRLRSITGHGELDLPGMTFVRVTPLGRINTYGLGMSLVKLMRNPLDAAGHVDLDAPVRV
jgi:nitroimidazol reductase NimA-like FMN-containing flavoprotein (pyridoxamine 5'-phosphate oxidase superfamily)